MTKKPTLKKDKPEKGAKGVYLKRGSNKKYSGHTPHEESSNYLAALTRWKENE